MTTSELKNVTASQKMCRVDQSCLDRRITIATKMLGGALMLHSTARFNCCIGIKPNAGIFPTPKLNIVLLGLHDMLLASNEWINWCL